MMKVMDWYMRQFIEYEAMPDKDKPIIIKVPYGTYEYVKLYFQYGCEGGYDYQFKGVGISLDDLKEAVEKKLMKHREYSSWEARQRGMTDYYSITIKGIKAIYNEMNAQ